LEAAVDFDDEDIMPPSPDPRLLALRSRIGWLGAAIDAGSVFLVFGVLVHQMSTAPDFAKEIVDIFRKFDLDPGLVTTSVLAMLFFVNLIATVIMALQLLAISRLVHGYLDGDVFSLRAIDRLRRIAFVGYGGAGFDLVARPLVGLATSSTVFDKLPIVTWFNPDTLSLAIFSSLLLALASIFRTALVFAREHAEFV
jgi:hypothetical protein